MPETLFANSTVRLFGHRFGGLDLVKEDGHDALKGAPSVLRVLQEQLKSRHGAESAAPGLARIYGFSYLGNYYKLAEPTVLLVHGEGTDVPATTNSAALSLLGIELKAETFSSDVKVWEQDKADYTVRIDITPGWLADVLVDPGISDGVNMTTGRAPESGGGSSLSGRSPMVGRACLVGRGNSC
jgi:hypothetical protein